MIHFLVFLTVVGSSLEMVTFSKTQFNCMSMSSEGKFVHAKYSSTTWPFHPLFLRFFEALVLKVATGCKLKDM